MRVEIWTDIACPWCYVGRARFERGLASFERRGEVAVVHRSYELNPRATSGAVPIIDAVAAQYGRTRDEQIAREEHAAGMAREMGLDFRIGGRVFGNTFDVHRLVHFAESQGRQSELMDLAFRANFAQERSIYDRETQVALAVEAGLDGAAARDVLDDPTAFAAAVRADEQMAEELGAGGVPFFVMNRRYGVSGVQSSEAFTQALRQAWDEKAAA